VFKPSSARCSLVLSLGEAQREGAIAGARDPQVERLRLNPINAERRGR